MKPITITKEDSANYNDFAAGNSVQVRVSVADDDIATYKKGTTVNVIHEGNENKAKIISDPLILSPESLKGPKILSLIVEKIS